MPLIIYDAPPLFEDEDRLTNLTLDLRVTTLKESGQRLVTYEAVGDRGVISGVAALAPKTTITEGVRQVMNEVYQVLKDIT